MLGGSPRQTTPQGSLPPYYTQRLHVVRPPSRESGRQDSPHDEAESQAERLFRDFKLGVLALVIMALLLLAYFWDGERVVGLEREPDGEVLAFCISGVRRAELVPSIPVDVPAPEKTPAVRDGATQQVRETVYLVKPGDTLGGIAVRFYGDASRWKAILDANSGTLRRPADLRPGMKLLIPAVPGRGPPPPQLRTRTEPVGVR